jgi:hypothetical protein
VTARLPDAEQHIIVRRYSIGHSIRRIATSIGRSFGAVRRVAAAAGIMRSRGGTRGKRTTHGETTC